MRRFLTWCALMIFGLGSLAAAVRVARTELAATAPFGREDLHHWLMTTEPSRQPPRPEATALRRRAARQLDRDFHAGYDWQPIYSTLSTSAERGRFEANFRSLLYLLIEQRADAYAALPPPHREHFLDTELNDLVTWYMIGPRGRLSGIELFQQTLVDGGAASQAAALPRKVREFAGVVQAHVDKRSLRRLLPPGTTAKPNRDE